MSRIRYQPLNFSRPEFRLLELQPGGDLNEPISCRLVTVNLNHEPEFLALSCLYADRMETQRININGYPMAIPAQLEEALRYVRAVFFPTMRQPPAVAGGQQQQQQQEKAQSTREKRAPRWLLHLLKHVSSILPDPALERTTPLRIYVDLLCVNQHEERETTRVRLAQVLGAARMVIGWLGPKMEHSDAALAVLREIDDAMPRNWGDPEDRVEHPENYAPKHEWARKIRYMWENDASGESFFARDYWVGSFDFMSRPLFQRRWILEEIALARYPTFMIGDSIVSWLQVLRLNKLLEEFKNHESDVCPAYARAAIYDDLPLGTVHELLDEFDRRNREERGNQRSDDSSESSSHYGASLYKTLTTQKQSR